MPASLRGLDGLDGASAGGTQESKLLQGRARIRGLRDRSTGEVRATNQMHPFVDCLGQITLRLDVGGMKSADAHLS